MACAGIIDHELIDGVDKYWVDPYRHSALISQAHDSTLTTACGEAHSLVHACFPLDGPPGTAVDDYPELHKYLAVRPPTSNFYVPNRLEIFFTECESVKQLLGSGAEVLEIGCGAAIGVKKAATDFPKSNFLATDLSPTILEGAAANCAGLPNVRCEVLDACSIPDDMAGKFDMVFLFDVFHDLPYPDKLAEGIRKALKPGGHLLMNDIDASESVSQNKTKMGDLAPFYYAVSYHYCTPTSLYHSEGMGLGTLAGRELIERMLYDAGFSQVEKVAPSKGLFFLATK